MPFQNKTEFFNFLSSRSEKGFAELHVYFNKKFFRPFPHPILQGEKIPRVEMWATFARLFSRFSSNGISESINNSFKTFINRQTNLRLDHLFVELKHFSDSFLKKERSRDYGTSSVYLDSGRQGQNLRNCKIAQYLHTNPHGKQLVGIDFCENTIIVKAFEYEIKKLLDVEDFLKKDFQSTRKSSGIVTRPKDPFLRLKGFERNNIGYKTYIIQLNGNQTFSNSMFFECKYCTKVHQTSSDLFGVEKVYMSFFYLYL